MNTDWQALPNIFTALALLGVTWHVWQNRKSQQNYRLRMILLISVVTWLLADAFTILSDTLAAKAFWDSMHYIGGTVVPTAAFLIAWKRTAPKKQHDQALILLLSIVPVVITVLAFTNEWHGLIREPLSSNMDAVRAFSPQGFRTVVWLYILYAYGLVNYSIIRIFNTLRKTGRPRRRQYVALVLGVFIVTLFSVWDFVIIHPALEIEITPLVTGFAVTILALRYRWLQRSDLLPIASQAIMESIKDAIIVLSTDWRILSMNPAAEQLVGHTTREIEGQRIQTLWPQLNSNGAPSLSQTSGSQELMIGEGDTLRVFDASLSVIEDNTGRTSGRTLVLRDITQREQARRQILALNTELSAEIQVREQAEDMLRQLLEEKDVLLKEIHHRVKNNLQIVSSLLSLQASYSTKDNHANEILKDSQNRIRSMALVHEQLYKSTDLAHIDFEEYVQILTSSLLSSTTMSQSHIHLHTEIAKVSMEADAAVTCGLLISELATNAIKHAFPNGTNGTLTIRFQPAENAHYRLTIQDDGAGLPTNIDLSTPASLGMQLVNSLVTQLDGTWKHIDDHVPGTTIEVIIPTASLHLGSSKIAKE